MTQQVKLIIQNVLELNGAAHRPQNCEELADKCAQALTREVLAQVAALLGGSIEVDNHGQAIIYTDVGVDDGNYPLHDFLG